MYPFAVNYGKGPTDVSILVVFVFYVYHTDDIQILVSDASYQTQPSVCSTWFCEFDSFILCLLYKPIQSYSIFIFLLFALFPNFPYSDIRNSTRNFCEWYQFPLQQNLNLLGKQHFAPKCGRVWNYWYSPGFLSPLTCAAPHTKWRKECGIVISLIAGGAISAIDLPQHD